MDHCDQFRNKSMVTLNTSELSCDQQDSVYQVHLSLFVRRENMLHNKTTFYFDQIQNTTNSRSIIN
ncbi:hypothetical protein PILCRDRAFT_299000 [Piloderma croceum F 1598]|uniref:Uncharacterized protein n=1 Tax=Piloderma croceum (strain F 1598) TaxID=765440 RepID=A0A0C3FSE9_PILCF|nr:hypothetical protein PILCRDRAFT_299000 [Piloderma croceum F 1598]